VNDDKYANLRGWLAKATPGPWESPLYDLGDTYFDSTYEAYPPLGESGPVVVTGCPDNMALVVEARNTLPTLLADLDAVTRERDDLKDNALSLALWKSDWHEKCVMAERERDALRTENAKLREVLDGMMKKCRCRGKGVYTRDCTLCGDSTFDHVCNDEERPCTDPACTLARTTLGEKQ
jgi:hypothetical protein